MAPYNEPARLLVANQAATIRLVDTAIKLAGDMDVLQNRHNTGDYENCT